MNGNSQKAQQGRTCGKLKIRKKDGINVLFNPQKIRKTVSRACEKYLDTTSVDSIVKELTRNIFDGATTEDLERALILSSTAFIERDPDYSKVSANLFLQRLYKESMEVSVTSDTLESQYRETFINGIRLGVKHGYLTEKLLDIVKIVKDNEDKIFYEALSDEELLPKVAKLISEGNIIGWVRGQLEFGARALGNRSILADPRDPQMKRRVNMVVKKREGFRPFAPMCCYDDMKNFFTPNIEIPYMNQIVSVNPKYRKKLPSITHIDGSARVQTLREDFNPKMHRLLKEYQKITKYPILLNTSFNLKDQTMVRDSQEAIDTFMNCDMDYLVLDNIFISKKILSETLT